MIAGQPSIDRVCDRVQRGGDDAGMHTDAPYCLVVDVGFDVGGGCGIGAGGHGMLVVVQDSDPDAELAVDCLDEGGDGAVARAVKLGEVAIDGYLCGDLVVLAA